MKTNSLKVTAVVLAAVMSVGGTAGVLAETPTAGVTSYTSSCLSTASLPTAGFSSEIMQVAVDCEETAQVAAANPGIAETEVVAVTSEYASYAVANVEDFVYIRSEANTESEYVGKLHANCVAIVLEETADGWYKIQSGSCEGYIKSEYLITNDEAAVLAVSRRVATVGCNGLRIRKEASTDAKILGIVSEGDDLTVTDESIEGWVGVSIEEGNGYVAIDYVTLSTEFKYAESREEEAARIKKEEEAKKKAQEAAARRSSSSSSSSNPGRTYDAPSGCDGQSVVDYACQFVGNPYRYGGSSLTNGTDCSGFVMSVYSAFGISLPHSSSSLRSSGAYVDGIENAQPGDIICYSGHVGIYVGDGQIVHASNRRTGIIVSSAYYRNILAVRRIF